MLVTLNQPDLKRSKFLAEQAADVLEGLVRANQRYIEHQARNGVRIPLPYQAGVRYAEEPDNGYEQFDDIPTVQRRGWGDCDDLAAWVCAWRRAHGEACTLRITWRRQRNGRRMFHVVVRRGNGSIEDPSKLLGMNGAAQQEPAPNPKPLISGAAPRAPRALLELFPRFKVA